MVHLIVIGYNVITVSGIQWALINTNGIEIDSVHFKM